MAIKIELNDFVGEDIELIQELLSMGVPEEVIQNAYNETQRRREENE